jgi:hypothetical protein
VILVDVSRRLPQGVCRKGPAATVPASVATQAACQRWRGLARQRLPDGRQILPWRDRPLPGRAASWQARGLPGRGGGGDGAIA